MLKIIIIHSPSFTKEGLKSIHSPSFTKEGLKSIHSPSFTKEGVRGVVTWIQKDQLIQLLVIHITTPLPPPAYRRGNVYVNCKTSNTGKYKKTTLYKVVLKSRLTLIYSFSCLLFLRA